MNEWLARVKDASAFAKRCVLGAVAATAVLLFDQQHAQELGQEGVRLWLETLRPGLVAFVSHRWVEPVVAWIMAPGLVFFERFRLTGEWLLAPFLIGWYYWLWLVRTCVFSTGRVFGFAGPELRFAFKYLWIPWQRPYQLYGRCRRYLWQLANGGGPSQYWGGFLRIASSPFNPARSDIPLGRLALFQRVGLHMTAALEDWEKIAEKAVVCIAASGSGKTSWIAYWLGCLSRKQAACLFDMDGALVNGFGALLRALGHVVTKIDVDHINKSFPDGKWNPLSELTAACKRHGAAAVSAFANLLSEALIVEDSTTQPVFARTARVIMKAIILYVWLIEEHKTLIRVRQLLNRGLEDKVERDDESPFGRFLFEMSALPARYADGEINDGCGGAICNEIANCVGLLAASGQGHDTAAGTPDNFRKTAIYQTAWIDDANVVQVIGGESDFSCDSLKLSNNVIFIVSTLTDTQTRLAPLVRTLVMMMIYCFQRTEPDMKLKYPMLLILDEFPNLGKGLDICAVAAPGFRKFGLRLVIISQSIGLLREASPARYREFLNQAACVIWMGIAPTDKESLEHLSHDVLGQCVRLEKLDGYGLLARFFAGCIGLKLPPARNQRRDDWLLTPQQAAAYLSTGTGQTIVTFGDGRPPWRLKQLLYWKELAVWKYRVHRGHGEALLRAGTRALVSLVRKGDAQ